MSGEEREKEKEGWVREKEKKEREKRAMEASAAARKAISSTKAKRARGVGSLSIGVLAPECDPRRHDESLRKESFAIDESGKARCESSSPRIAPAALNRLVRRRPSTIFHRRL